MTSGSRESHNVSLGEEASLAFINYNDSCNCSYSLIERHSNLRRRPNYLVAVVFLVSQNRKRNH